MAITYPQSCAILAPPVRRGPIASLLEQEHWLAVVLLLPTVVLIAYPLVKGVTLSVADAKVGVPGSFANFEKEAIPPELEEFDGASRLKAMIYIIFPLAS
ncbi:MAG: hypothetical protein JO283_01815 [Bradyrhizobium sp.]|nr:hypothetical protein [Bradyrhizobium sp.]